MLTIPAAIQTLLKSKQMTGENRPTGYIKLGNQPNNYDMLAPTTWTTWRNFVSDGKSGGNMCETQDGRAIIIYCESNIVKIAYADTVVGVLDGTETFATGAAVTVASDKTYTDTSMTLIDGKLYAVLKYLEDSVYKAAFWRDTDGNGTSFAKVSDITLDCGPPTLGQGCTSLIHKLGNGNLACIITQISTGGITYMGMRAHYSTDNGANWISGEVWWPNTTARIYSSHSKSVLFIGQDTFVSAHVSSDTSTFLLVWSASGATVAQSGWTADWGGQYVSPWFVGFISVGKKHYMIKYATDTHAEVLQLNYETPTIDNIKSSADWTQIKEIPFVENPRVDNFFVLSKEALICQHSIDGSLVSGAGTEVAENVLRPKSITIDRSKGSASQATVVLDNKGGQYAPDPAGIWHEVIWPNADLEVYLGYGATQQLVFSGLLDDLTMSNYPAEISFTARDYSKRALDQMVQDGGVYSIPYTSQTPEYIFNDLATKAGFTDITTEVTGLAIAEITFEQENYGDAFQRLCELVGFEWFCDEAGALFFRLAVEPTPVAAYSFVEGVDIFSLDYTISDTELYYKVVVISQDADGNTVSGTADYAGKDAYDVLPQKTMIIQATDLASTAEQCATLAATAAAAIKPKPRQVNFVVVGHPYLQIGDCIQVTETTSTISEIYRIFELTHQMDASGSPVFATTIRCYHYAAA